MYGMYNKGGAAGCFRSNYLKRSNKYTLLDLGERSKSEIDNKKKKKKQGYGLA